MARLLRLAHRGDPRAAPENTLGAFAAALRVPGCDGIELDVRAARDGVPVVLHDRTLARVFGRPERVGDLATAELEAVAIPTLAAALDLAGPTAFLDVELKEDAVDEVVSAIRAARGPAPPRTVVSSFDPAILAHLRRVAPGLPAWLNAVALDPATLDLARSIGCAGVAAERASIVGDTVARAARAGLAVAAWTVIDPAEIPRLESLGVVAACVEGPALG